MLEDAFSALLEAVWIGSSMNMARKYPRLRHYLLHQRCFLLGSRAPAVVERKMGLFRIVVCCEIWVQEWPPLRGP